MLICRLGIRREDYEKVLVTTWLGKQGTERGFGSHVVRRMVMEKRVRRRRSDKISFGDHVIFERSDENFSRYVVRGRHGMVRRMFSGLVRKKGECLAREA